MGKEAFITSKIAPQKMSSMWGTEQQANAPLTINRYQYDGEISAILPTCPDGNEML